MLDIHATARAWARAAPSVGIKMPTSKAMMPITTRSSTSVNAAVAEGLITHGGASRRTRGLCEGFMATSLAAAHARAAKYSHSTRQRFKRRRRAAGRKSPRSVRGTCAGGSGEGRGATVQREGEAGDARGGVCDEGPFAGAIESALDHGHGRRRRQAGHEEADGAVAGRA